MQNLEIIDNWHSSSVRNNTKLENNPNWPDRQLVGICTVHKSSDDSSVDVPMKSNVKQLWVSLSVCVNNPCWNGHTTLVPSTRHSQTIEATHRQKQNQSRFDESTPSFPPQSEVNFLHRNPVARQTAAHGCCLDAPFPHNLHQQCHADTRSPLPFAVSSIFYD